MKSVQWKPIPVLLLAVFLLSGCGGESKMSGESLRSLYREAAECRMEAAVSCTYEDGLWTAVLQCTYLPEGGSTVEAVSPEMIAGVRAVLDGENRYLTCDGTVLNAGPVSREEITPAECLPRLMDALRDGWLLEENTEIRDGIPCLRLCIDERGETAEKRYSTLWLRQEDGTPVRGEISVDGETVLTAEFTSFVFCDTIDNE